MNTLDHVNDTIHETFTEVMEQLDTNREAFFRARKILPAFHEPILAVFRIYKEMLQDEVLWEHMGKHQQCLVAPMLTIVNNLRMASAFESPGEEGEKTLELLQGYLQGWESPKEMRNKLFDVVEHVQRCFESVYERVTEGPPPVPQEEEEGPEEAKEDVLSAFFNNIN